MQDLVHLVHPKHVREFRPGRQGPVGMTSKLRRLRSNTPFDPPHYDPYLSGHRIGMLGANVQDGDTISYCSGGGPPKLIRRKLIGNRGFKHAYGRIIQDIIPPQKTHIPQPISLGPYSWRTKLAMVHRVGKGQKAFSIIPGPFELGPGELARGGSTPRSTVIVDETELGTTAFSGNIVTGGLEGKNAAGGSLPPLAPPPPKTEPVHKGTFSHINKRVR
jgi:hypothetical protein